jgi:hypothetical protein
MRYEGETFLRSAQRCWVIVDPDGTVRCPQSTRWTSGIIALILPEGVQVEALHLEPELLAGGLDLAGNGHQYGDTIYLRSHSGYVLQPEVLGTAVLKLAQGGADAASKAPRRRRQATPEAA